MATRVIKKNLIGEEDLLLGEGQVTQSRNDLDYTITKVRVIRPVNSITELNLLDTDKFVKAALFEGTQVKFYSFNSTSGLWVLQLDSSVQELTGAGAVDITAATTHLITNATNALTLGDGSEGQIKNIIMKTDGGDGTLTPTNLGNGTTITFDDAGDSAQLLFTNDAWYFMGGTATLV